MYSVPWCDLCARGMFLRVLLVRLQWESCLWVERSVCVPVCLLLTTVSPIQNRWTDRGAGYIGYRYMDIHVRSLYFLVNIRTKFIWETIPERSGRDQGHVAHSKCWSPNHISGPTGVRIVRYCTQLGCMKLLVNSDQCCVLYHVFLEFYTPRNISKTGYCHSFSASSSIFVLVSRLLRVASIR